jgi:hypothetical protein
MGHTRQISGAEAHVHFIGGLRGAEAPLFHENLKGFGVPILGSAPSFSFNSLASDFSILSNRGMRRHSRVFPDAAFFVLKVLDEKAEAENYQGQEYARGVGGVGVYGAGERARAAGEQALGRFGKF